MGINSLILLITPVIGGAAFLLKPISQPTFRLSLVFAGSYLFGITIVDLIPHLFSVHGQAHQAHVLGFGILAGFFIQQILEFFSRGIEHGHMHHESGPGLNGHAISIPVVVGALSLHAFLEGSLLAGFDQGGNPILLGIVVHKVPAAYALMAIVSVQNRKLEVSFLILAIFTLASPLGLLFSSQLDHTSVFSKDILPVLFAIVAGSFLHISTTIVFESDSPAHRLGISKFLVALAGAILAILTVWVS